MVQGPRIDMAGSIVFCAPNRSGVCKGLHSKFSMSKVIFLISASVLSAGVIAIAPRNAAELLASERANRCPATGERGGACPRYAIDRAQIVSL